MATTNLANIFLPSDQKYIEVQQQVIYMSHEMESLKIGQRQGILGAVVMLFSARAIIRHGGSKIGAGLLLLLGCEAASVF